jgi:DNA-binding MarR family transcriptional regulator
MNNRKNPIKEILTNAKFNSGEKLLMIALLFDQEDMNIWTNKAIGERIGVLGNSVSKYLKRLESLGYIRISYYKEQGHLFRNIQIINY